MKIKNVIRWVLAIIIYFLLSYFWVEERDLWNAVRSTIILFVVLAIIEAVAYFWERRKQKDG